VEGGGEKKKNTGVTDPKLRGRDEERNQKKHRSREGKKGGGGEKKRRGGGENNAPGDSTSRPDRIDEWRMKEKKNASVPREGGEKNFRPYP